MSLDYNEVVQFMIAFKIDILNRFEELIIDEPTNTYVNVKGCENIEDLKLRVVYAISRPIGKGLEKIDANRLLKRFNDYFKTELTRSDFLLIYNKFGCLSKIQEFKDFIRKGFPVETLCEDD